MRTLLLTIITTLLLTTGNAQTFSELLEKGKNSLKNTRNRYGNGTDFDTAINYLEQAVKLNPGDPEVHYFLGNAYDYSGDPDASKITEIKVSTIMLASREIETAIKLSPKYTGEIVTLDPYTKITAIWGTLAMSYLARGIHDSARWAFTEGKKRGGYSELSLAYRRAIFDNCAKDAILFLSGDEPCMTSWYLQEVEHYRTDICLVNTDMLQLPWYSDYISKGYPTLFSSRLVATDTTPYRTATDTTFKITIRNTGKIFKWTPTRQRPDYILRSEELFENIVNHNGFKRRMYYEKNYPNELMMGLHDYKRNDVLLYEVSTSKNDTPTKEFVASAATFSLDMVSKVNGNIDYDLSNIICMRYSLINDIWWLEQQKHMKQAKELYRKLAKAIPGGKYPYDDKYCADYMASHNDWLKD